MDFDDEIDGVVNGEAVKTCLTSFIDEGTVESHRYYLARRTALEMLKDRGYAVPSAEIELSLEDFRTHYSQTPDPDKLQITTKLLSDQEKQVMAYFTGPGVVKLTEIRHIAAEVAIKDLSCLILVVQDRVTNQAMSHVGILPYKVEVFQITDLLVNFTRHAMKPKHQILTPKEKEDLLKTYSLDEKQLPKMSVKDAVARYYGLQKGQVVKVMHESEMTRSYVTYRCVS